jgi:hypothetical protein
MQGKELDKHTVLAIQELRRKGFSVRKCAELLNVGKASVERHGEGVAAGPVAPITKKDRETKLEKIIDLSSERIIEELDSDRKIPLGQLNVLMGTAWDKRHGKEGADISLPANLMINLFGHGVGEKLARSLGCAAMGQAAHGEASSVTDVVDGEVETIQHEQETAI